jgi:uroporphyrinogen-III synthase
MTVLIPRARLDLSSPAFEFLSLSEAEKKHYQALLDESDLEKRLEKAFGEEVRSVITTCIEPNSQVCEFAGEIKEPFDLIIIVSKNAALLARLLFPISFFEAAQVFSVGRSSHAFFKNEAIDISSAELESAKGLLGLEVFSDLKNKRVAIIKGYEGLDTLEQACTDRGAQLEVFNLYQRTAADEQTHEQEFRALEFSSVYGVSVFALQHLLQSISDRALKQRILKLPLYAMSERISDAARNMGFSEIKVKKI